MKREPSGYRGNRTGQEQLSMTGLLEFHPPAARTEKDTTDAPACLKRAAVPGYFPQFKNAATLAHLAHKRCGPRYVLVGGQAWYDISDIRMWLDQQKRSGPTTPAKREQNPINNRQTGSTAKKRGRPTKAEQMRRRSAP
jgi:hypothetical protein